MAGTVYTLLLQPSLGQLTSADFDRAPELVKIGEDYARSVQAALQRFAAEPERYAHWRDARTRQAMANAARNPWLGQLRFEGVSEARSQRLAQTLEDGLEPLVGFRSEVFLRTPAQLQLIAQRHRRAGIALSRLRSGQGALLAFGRA